MDEVAFCLDDRTTPSRSSRTPAEFQRASCGTEPATKPGAMSNTMNTATEEREQWRAKILRALAELRGDELAGGGSRRDEDREDGATRDSS